MRASSAIAFPPTPLAAIHPELGRMVEQTLVQFLRGWLHGVSSVAVAFSPPWGNAWKIPVGNLADEDLREHVEWELQQRLKDSLRSNIYAWNRVNGDAYAVVIRPEMLSYWEDLLSKRGLKLASIHISAGLVDPQVENEADLLPLLHLWKEKGRADQEESDFSIEIPDQIIAAVEAGEEETPAPREIETTQVPEERLPDADDLIQEAKLRHRKRPRRLLRIVIPVIAGLGLAASGWLFRDDLGELPHRASVIVRQTLEKARQEPSQPVVSPVPEPVAGKPAVETPPGQGDNTGMVLETLYSLADEEGVSLTAVILQDSELLVETEGPAEAQVLWRNAVEAHTKFRAETAESRGEDFKLNTFALASSGGGLLSVTQFDQWATQLGMSTQGNQVYLADRAMLTGLFTLMRETGARPWRLSLHLTRPNQYHVMMLP